MCGGLEVVLLDTFVAYFFQMRKFKKIARSCERENISELGRHKFALKDLSYIREAF